MSTIGKLLPRLAYSALPVQAFLVKDDTIAAVVESNSVAVVAIESGAPSNKSSNISYVYIPAMTKGTAIYENKVVTFKKKNTFAENYLCGKIC